jgi:hypothetical protein
MAEQPKYFDIEDTETGKTYRIETDDPSATYDEAVEYFSALPETDWTAFELNKASPAPASAPEAVAPVVAPTGQVEIARERDVKNNLVTASQMTADTFDQYDNYEIKPMSSEDEQTYVLMSEDPRVSFKELQNWAAERGAVLGPEAEENLKALRASLAEGKPVDRSVSYERLASGLLGDFVPQEDPTVDSDLGASLEKGMAYNPMGIVTRMITDFMDGEIGGFDKDTLRQQYPDLGEDAIEDLHDNLIGEMRRRELINANYQVDTRKVNMLVDFFGDVVGGASPVDLIGASRAASVGQKLALAGGTNYLTDAALQAGDIAYGAQQRYDPVQGAVAAASGVALQGTIDLGVAGLKKVFRRTPDTPAPAAVSAPIVAPTAKGNTKAYKVQIEEARTQIVDKVNALTKGWTNAPKIAVHENFSQLPGTDKTAIGLYTTEKLPDGSTVPVVRINTQALFRSAAKRNVSPESLIEAVTFHETLGHHGLLSMFRNDLEDFLDDIYTNGDAKFRAEVDKWLADNPTAYGKLGKERRRIFATEEVLAEASESGPITRTKLDGIANYIKDFARTRLGPFSMDLKYSQREIRTYLSVAHEKAMKGARSESGPSTPRNMDERTPDTTSAGFKQPKADDRSRAAARKQLWKNKENPDWNPDDPNGLPSEPKYMAGEEDLELDIREERGPSYQADGKTVKQWVAYTPEGEFLAVARRMPFQKMEDVYKRLREDAARNYKQKREGITSEYGLVGGVNEITSRDKYMRGDKKTSDEGDFERRMTTILEEVKEAYVPTERSQAEAQRAAKLAGLRSRQYKGEKGLEDLDIRLFQYEAVNERYQAKLLRLSERIDNPKDPNDYVRASDDFKRTLYEYKMLASKIQGDQAQIGRALNAMKALNMTKRKVNETLGLIDGTFGNRTDAEAFAALDDPATLEALAKMMSAHISSGNQLAAAKIAEKVGKPYWWQYVLSYLHNSMLSGLGTHAVNAYDAVNVLGRKLEERVVGGVIGQSRRALGAKDTMSMMESVGFTFGILRAFADAETYRNTYRAFKEGYEFQPFDARIERQDARIPGLSVINDLLYASDMFWRSFHMSANLYSLGVRKAYADGFRGKQLFEEGYANAINGDKTLFDEAKRHADEALLVDKPSAITSWVESGKSIKPNMTIGQQTRAFTLNLLFPFLRVSDRLVFQALKRVPLVAFLDRNSRREWAMGGAARDAVMARQLMGAALISYYWMMADPEDADKEGYIEGYGDPDYQKTQALEATGYRRETVTEEDEVMRNANQINVTANPLNTRNNIAVLVASIRQDWEKSKKTEEDANELALLMTSVMRSSGSFLMKQGYADNVTPYVEAMKASKQQEGAVAAAAIDITGRAVPAIVRQANQMYFDPIKRDTTGDKSVTDRVFGNAQASIPGLSNLLPANVTSLGDEQEQGRTLLRLGDGTAIKKGVPYEELRKLEREVADPVLTEFRDSFTYGGKNIKLNSFEKNKWQSLQGQKIKEIMSEWVVSPEWKEMSTEEKAELVKEVKSEAYDYAKGKMLDELLTARGYEE